MGPRSPAVDIRGHVVLRQGKRGYTTQLWARGYAAKLWTEGKWGYARASGATPPNCGQRASGATQPSCGHRAGGETPGQVGLHQPVVGKDKWGCAAQLWTEGK